MEVNDEVDYSAYLDLNGNRATGSNEESDEVIDITDNSEAEGNNTSTASAATEKNPFQFSSKRKRKNQAKVWEFMNAISETSAKCIKCEETVSHPSGQTSVMIMHIKACDAESYKMIRKDIEDKNETRKKSKQEELKKSDKQEKISNFISVTRSLPKVTVDKIDTTMMEWIASTNNSFLCPENYFFRKMVFNLNSSYICPSATKITRMVDKKKVEVDAKLKEELEQDMTGCKTASITSDGGTSCDRMKTKKSSLTITRITEDFKLKTDTLAVKTAEGSQTGEVIKFDWKQILTKFGHDSTWRINATTDAASPERSARGRNRHYHIGLNIKYETDCVDHQVRIYLK